MTDISRRRFLAGTTAAVVSAAIAPAVLRPLDMVIERPGENLLINTPAAVDVFGLQVEAAASNPGYVLSYYAKKATEGQWRRYVEHIGEMPTSKPIEISGGHRLRLVK